MKRILSITLVLLLLLCSCGQTPKKVTDSKEIKTFDECVEGIDAAVKQIWADRYILESSENSVTLSSCSDGVSSGMHRALLGNSACIDSWNEMTQQFCELSKNVQGVFVRNELNSVDAIVNILDEDTHEELLFSARNGKTVYDPVNNIDLIGFNAAIGKSIGESFEGVIDGSEVTAHANFDDVTVSIKSTLSASNEPDNWEDVSNQILEICNGVETSLRLTTVVEAAGGEILLTVANGKILYDYYDRGETTSQKSAISGNISSYVLNTNTMKFHSPPCGSVSDIKQENREDVTAVRDDLIAQGYTPCGRCKP